MKQFAWVPYRRRHCQLMIPDGWEQPAWRATCPLICFEIVCWHSANRVRRQFGLVQPLPSPPKNLENSHNRDMGRLGNWETNHDYWIRYWNSRRRRLEEGEQTRTFVMSGPYWEWYSRHLAIGLIYLSASLRHTHPPANVVPERFAEWENDIDQIPPHRLNNPAPYPGHDWIPRRRRQQVVHDDDDDDDDGEDDDGHDDDDGDDDDGDDAGDDDDDDGDACGDYAHGDQQYQRTEDRQEEQRPQQQEDHYEPSQPPVYGHVLQQMGLFDIQWQDWSTPEPAPTQYVGWDPVESPGQHYYLPYEPHNDDSFDVNAQQNIEFTADFRGSFMPSQGSNEASSSAGPSKGKKKKESERKKRVVREPDRFSHSKYR